MQFSSGDGLANAKWDYCKYFRKLVSIKEKTRKRCIYKRMKNCSIAQRKEEHFVAFNEETRKLSLLIFFFTDLVLRDLGSLD